MPAHVRLILVPGTRFSAGLWEPYRALLPGVDVVPVDLPGHGARLGEEFTTEAAVATVADAVAGRAPGQRVVVAGHSLGGYMALLYAAGAATPPDALVLLGTTGDPTSRWALLYRGFARALPYVGPDRMARVLNAIMRLLGARGEYAGSLPDGSGYGALPAAWGSVMTECGPHLLEGVSCPVVLAVRQDHRTGRATARSPRPGDR